MKDAYQVILQPLITEKSTILRESNKYAFVVDRNATKPQIRRAAERIVRYSWGCPQGSHNARSW